MVPGEAYATAPDNSMDSDQADWKAVKSVQDIHPFFLPLASKRANAAPGHDNRVSATHDSACSIKRQKKRNGSHKHKSAKIQSFFKVNTSRADSVSLTQDMEQLVCETSAAVSNVTEPGTKEKVGLAPTNGSRPEDTHGIRSQRQRTSFRLPGIPAPYPNGDTHVPKPRHTRYYSAPCVASPERCRRISSQNIDLASGHGEIDYLQHFHTNGQEDGFVFRSRTTDKPAPNPGLSGVCSLNASAAPIKIALGDISSVLPQHMSFLKPVVDAICGNQPHSLAQKDQLLASRYRPKRICHVLANQQAALQFRSWIVEMRVKRSNQTLGDTANSVDLFVETAASSKSRRDGFISAFNVKRDRNSNNSGSDNDGNYPYTTGDYNSDSSDDFVPLRVTKRRQHQNFDGLHGVFAWAKSNGTLDSVRDNLHRGTRHRRSGSGYTSSSEIETFSNMVLLTGPSGSCKTAAVYACAEECNFEICEIHPGQRRSGKDILDALEDALLSHTIAATSKCGSVKPDNTTNQMLILVEQIDILFEQDHRLWPALKQLALKSKRPIVLTCNDMSCMRWDEACFQHVFHFHRPKEHALVPYIFFMCLAEGALVSPSNISSACRAVECDINQILSSLEIAIRCARIQSSVQSTNSSVDSIDKDALLCTEYPGINLEGAIAWLLEPLSSQETPESRFNFWIELVASAQTAERTGFWYKKWPDPPPQQQPADVDDNIHILSASHNRFFGSSVPLLTSSLARNTTDVQQSNDKRPCKVCTSIPMAMPSCEYTYPANCVSEPPQSSLSSLEEIELTSYALDMLSFAYATTGVTEFHAESLYEPMYSHKAPMTDGCLNVSYITLDADVLGSKNAELLADGFGNDRYGSTCIDDYLRQAAFRGLCLSDGSQPLADQMGTYQKAQETSRPLGSHSAGTSHCKTMRELHQALEYVGLSARHRMLPRLALETASFLAKMVFWDWVHLKKVESPTILNQGLQCDEDKHGYRIGTRRTRRNAYRVHIKNMPESTQKYLAAWMNLQMLTNK